MIVQEIEEIRFVGKLKWVIDKTFCKTCHFALLCSFLKDDMCLLDALVSS